MKVFTVGEFDIGVTAQEEDITTTFRGYHASLHSKRSLGYLPYSPVFELPKATVVLNLVGKYFQLNSGQVAQFQNLGARRIG